MQQFTDATREQSTFNLTDIWCNEYRDLLEEGYDPQLSFYCRAKGAANPPTVLHTRVECLPRASLGKERVMNQFTSFLVWAAIGLSIWSLVLIFVF